MLPITRGVACSAAAMLTTAILAVFTHVAVAHATLEVAQAMPGSSYKGGTSSAHDISSQHSGGHGVPQGAAPQSYKAGALVITAPWARSTPKGAPVGGGYLSITNNGSEPDRLIGGSFAAAGGRVEVHEMKMEGGVMRMRPLTSGLEIKPGETVELKPGGYHLMFMGLKQQLKAGETVKGTLEFAKAGKVEVSYPVRAPGSPGAGGHKGH